MSQSIPATFVAALVSREHRVRPTLAVRLLRRLDRDPLLAEYESWAAPRRARRWP